MDNRTLAIVPEQVKNENYMREYLYNTGNFPDLFKKTTLGNVVKISVWRIRVTQSDDGTAIVRIFHGFLPDPNKPRVTDDDLTPVQPKYYTAGKNIGKINETTAWEQAFNEAVSLYIDKFGSMEPDFRALIADKIVLIGPMLALRYDNAKHHIEFPCAVQRKFDGDRCLATRGDTGKTILYKRSMDRILSCEHLRQELVFLFDAAEKYTKTLGRMFFDGEIYKHGLSLQKISGCINKKDAFVGQLEGLEYHIFDCFFTGNLNLTFSQRFGIVQECFQNISVNAKYLHIVETFRANNDDDITVLHQKFLADGFEGSIIRNERGLYKFSKGKSSGRSRDLLKLKSDEHEVVKILDIKEYDLTKADFGITLLVRDENYGVNFSVNGNGTQDYRREVLSKKSEYIGKKIMIKFIDRTSDFIPKFAYPELTDGKYTLVL